jgi:5-methylcytosine-specific restriction endonuclease McrA
VQAYNKTYYRIPENKAKDLARKQTPENKAKAKARDKARSQTPARKALRQTPRFKAFALAGAHRYNRSPEGKVNSGVQSRKRRAWKAQVEVRFLVQTERAVCLTCGHPFEGTFPKLLAKTVGHEPPLSRLDPALRWTTEYPECWGCNSAKGMRTNAELDREDVLTNLVVPAAQVARAWFGE